MNHLTLREVARGFIASTPADATRQGHLRFWIEALGDRDFTAITIDDVDEAIMTLARRGKMRPVRNGEPESTGKPLSPATLNRHVATLGALYKFARQQRLIPRGFRSPTNGIEKVPENNIDPNKYLTTAQIDKLIDAARIADRSWRKLPAFIRLAFTTGLRKGNLLELRWGDIDFQSRRITVRQTKNGTPLVAPLALSAVEELMRLPNRNSPDALVFGNRYNQPFSIRKIWMKAARLAGMPHITPHYLRHSCGTELARQGASQAQIMAVLNHKTLTASQRYLHLSVDDKAAVVDRIFR